MDTVQSYASVVEERDSGNVLVAHYDYGADRLRMDRGGAYYYVCDGLGSVRALTNASGTVTDTYAYDAFGNTTHGLGSSPNFHKVLSLRKLWSPAMSQTRLAGARSL